MTAPKAKGVEVAEITVPYQGVAKSADSLYEMVESAFDEFDKLTKEEYSAKAKSRARELGKTWKQYIQMLVEHQICVRIKNVSPAYVSKLCSSSGIGDTIHMLVSKTEETVISAAVSAVKAITHRTVKISPKASKCSACGGTQTFDPTRDNLGRAGKLN